MDTSTKQRIDATLPPRPKTQPSAAQSYLASLLNHENGPNEFQARKLQDNLEAPSRDQKTSREAWRLVSPVETLYRQNRLNDDQWQAWVRFERDLEKGGRVPSCTSAWGEQRGRGGDPAFCPATIKEQAYQRSLSALDAVGEPVLCGVLIACAQTETTLAKIGKDLYGMNRNQGAGAAVAAIQAGTYRLWQHYREIGVM